MSVKPINSALQSAKNQQLKERNQNNNKSNNNPSFKGFNPVVTVMDAIDKGGFAASFIAQDGIGMVAPRIYEGLNRNRKKDEKGNLTGPLNWEFARREGIREILSGPSAFLIPMGIMAGVKRLSGPANNVHISHIKALGNSFEDFAKDNHNILADSNKTKEEFYKKVFNNVLAESTDNNLSGEKLSNTAEEFAKKLLQIETTKNKKEAKKLSSELVDTFMDLRKSTTNSSNNELDVVFNTGDGKKLNTTFRRLTQSMQEYTDDVIKNVTKKADKAASSENIQGLIKDFNNKRIGSRLLSILGMFSAVVGFYTVIPKLYNMGLKKDPGLAGLEGAEENKPENTNDKQTAKADDKASKKDVAFKGGLASLGKNIASNQTAGKVIDKFEFNGASMSVPAMLTLLFGFCLPPRYTNAKSAHEKREILVRDVTSFTAILFAAKALARGFSDMFANLTGLALNIKPQDHSKSVLHKAKNYFTAGAGVDVLTSEQIVTKYSNIDKYKDGIVGFVDFLENNGGNAKKVLSMDSTVAENMKTILGKDLKDASIDEIKTSLKKAMQNKDTALDNIYKVYAGKDNKFIQRAKTCKSAFGFLSTLVLVPVFMMWLARFCEKMTKERVAKEAEMKKAQSQQQAQPQNNTTAQVTTTNNINKLSMTNFVK